MFTFRSKISFKSTCLPYSIKPGNNHIHLLIILTPNRKFVEKFFKFRQFLTLQHNTVKIHSFVLLYQSYIILPPS